ncbi:hypothetical protein KC338_g17 [Hortaea werneckii]|nr:hypothetical protein KC338_g17 [Hortaea werneckii]
MACLRSFVIASLAFCAVALRPELQQFASLGHARPSRLCCICQKMQDMILFELAFGLNLDDARTVQPFRSVRLSKILLEKLPKPPIAAMWICLPWANALSTIIFCPLAVWTVCTVGRMSGKRLFHL